MQKGSALIPLTLFIAVIVLAITSGWYYVNNESQSKPLNNPGPAQSFMAPERSEPNPEVYENSDLGFRFKYPSKYEVKVESEEEFYKRTNGNMRQNFKLTLSYEPAVFTTSLYVLKLNEDPKDAALSIWVSENPDNLTPKAFYKKYWYYPFIWGDFTYAKEKIVPTEDFRLGEATASSAIVEYQTNNPRFAYLSKNGRMFLFKTNGNDEFLKRIVFD